jgi:hypothetical protein
MVTLFVLAVAFLILFLPSYLLKKRFGVLGLSLAAGALISAYLETPATALLESQGVTLVQPPLSSVVAIALVLLPPFILFLGGPSHDKNIHRIVGSLLFAVMAFLLILPQLQNIFLIEPAANEMLDVIAKYKNWIISGLIIYAILDTMATRLGWLKGRGKKKKAH